MIRKATKRAVQDKTIYSPAFVSPIGDPNLTYYGSIDSAFILAEVIPEWLKSDSPYQNFLEMVDDSERMVKLIMGDDGKPHTKWCVTEKGIYQILKQVFDLVDGGEFDPSNDNIGYSRVQEVDEGIHFHWKYYPDELSKKTSKEDTEDQPRYTVNEIMENPDILINALRRLKEEQEKNRNLKAELAVQSEKIAELEPKAEYYDKILESKDAISVSVIAKKYGKSATWLNNWLHKNKIQFKLDGQWLLYAKYADKGYTCTKTTKFIDEFGNTHSKIHTYWTQAGRQFIYEKLKASGFDLVEKSEN